MSNLPVQSEIVKDFSHSRVHRFPGAAEIADMLQQRALDVVQHLLPNGKLLGHEYFVGNLAGEPGQSLKINIKTGVWSDFATHESGGDLLDLWKEVRGFHDMTAAMSEASAWLGLEPGARSSLQVKINGHGDGTWPPGDKIIGPVPNGLDPPNFQQLLGRTPDEVYDYLDPEGSLIGYTARLNGAWNKAKGKPDKSFRPVTLWKTAAGELTWKSKSWPTPRPLFGLQQLTAKPEALVLLLEGEKKAQAAWVNLPEFAAVSLNGGSGQTGHQDYSLLKDRHVVALPDNDEPGRKAMATAQRLALAAGAASFGIAKLPDDLPSGWDIADPLPEGFAIEQLRELILESAS